MGSGHNLLGDLHAEIGEELSPDLIADENTPKAFIWHSFDDEGVNVINSLDYAKRLHQMGVSVEMHNYPHGNHGLGLAENTPRVEEWSANLLRWLFEKSYKKQNFHCTPVSFYVRILLGILL